MMQWFFDAYKIMKAHLGTHFPEIAYVVIILAGGLVKSIIEKSFGAGWALLFLAVVVVAAVIAIIFKNKRKETIEELKELNRNLSEELSESRATNSRLNEWADDFGNQNVDRIRNFGREMLKLFCANLKTKDGDGFGLKDRASLFSYEKKAGHFILVSRYAPKPDFDARSDNEVKTYSANKSVLGMSWDRAEDICEINIDFKKIGVQDYDGLKTAEKNHAYVAYSIQKLGYGDTNESEEELRNMTMKSLHYLCFILSEDEAGSRSFALVIESLAAEQFDKSSVKTQLNEWQKALVSIGVEFKQNHSKFAK